MNDLQAGHPPTGQGPGDEQHVAPEDHAAQTILVHRVETANRFSGQVEDAELLVDRCAPFGCVK